MKSLLLNEEEQVFLDSGDKIYSIEESDGNFIFNFLNRAMEISGVKEQAIEQKIGSSLRAFTSIEALNEQYKDSDIYFYSLFNIRETEREITKQAFKAIPVLIDTEAVIVGPLSNEVSGFRDYIQSLLSNNGYFQRKEKIGIKEVFIQKNEIKNKIKQIKEAVSLLKKENKNNVVILAKDGTLKKHTFVKQVKKVEEQNNLLDAVDEQLGLVKDIQTKSLDYLGINTFISVSTTSDYSYYKKDMFAQANSGAGFDEHSAICSAVGESLERFAAGVYQPVSNQCTSWNHLKEEAVHPRKYLLFSEEQYEEQGFPYKKFDENTLVNWIESENITKKIKQLIPQSFVSLPYRTKTEETKISPSISTGLALGPTKEEAIISGIFETVERDAFINHWLLKLAPNKKVEIRDYLENFDQICSNRYICTAYDISLENMFNTALVTLHDTETNQFMIGAATRFTLSDALKKAFLEAAQGVTYVEMLVRNYRDDQLIDDFNRIDSFQKHAAFYSIYPEMRKKVGYILESDFQFNDRGNSVFDIDVSKMSGKEKLAVAIDTLERNGKEVNVVDMTTGELRYLNVSAVKVGIQGLSQLHGSHYFRYLNNQRLKHLSKKDVVELNDYPHPFP